MNKKLYAVVCFTKEDMYSEIPTSWLINEESGYWPKTLNARKLMRRGVEPDKDNWEVHELRIEGYSATLDGARKKAADSEYSTTEETQDVGRGRRRKIPPSWTRDDICGSSSDETMTPPPTPILKSNHRVLLYDPQKSNSNDVEVVTEGGVTIKTVLSSTSKKLTEWDKIENSQLNKNISDGSETPSIPLSAKQNIQPEEPVNISEDLAAGTAITLETLYEEIAKLRTICMSNKKFLNSIYTKVNSLEFGHQPNPQIDKLKNIPIKTLDEIQEFELQLENDDVKTSLAHLFKSLGGRDAKDHAYRCLGQLFSNELATQCSWFGQRGNYKAKDLHSIKILTECIISNHSDVSYSEIEKHAAEWFRLSRQRLNRDMKKKSAESQ